MDEVGVITEKYRECKICGDRDRIYGISELGSGGWFELFVNNVKRCLLCHNCGVSLRNTISKLDGANLNKFECTEYGPVSEFGTIDVSLNSDIGIMIINTRKKNDWEWARREEIIKADTKNKKEWEI